MMCPNCGYCPHCGRSGQHARPWIQGPIWIGGPYVQPNSWGWNTVGAMPLQTIGYHDTTPNAAAQPNVTITTFPNAIGAH